jgi:hypothetical protein
MEEPRVISATIHFFVDAVSLECRLVALRPAGFRSS